MFKYVVSSLSNHSNMTATNRLVWPALEAIRAVGIDVAAVLAPLGLSEEAAYAADRRVPLDHLFSVWKLAVEKTGNEALGIFIASFVDPSAAVSWPMPLSLVEHLGMVSPSLGEAITIWNRFTRLMRDAMQFEVEYDGDVAVFRLELTQNEPPALVELLMASCVNVARRVTRREFVPIEVWFTHKAPARLQAQSKLFRCPMRFEAPWNGAIVRAEDFTRPLETANRMLQARLLRDAEGLIEALPSLDAFEDKVCSQIEAVLQGGNTNAAAVAERIGVSSRTLHRRLQQESLSYQELLDRVRLRTSIRHLAAGKAIAQVATLVGFAQASTFHRAFKSWTGKTPAEYQELERPHLVRALQFVEADQKPSTGAIPLRARRLS